MRETNKSRLQELRQKALFGAAVNYKLARDIRRATTDNHPSPNIEGEYIGILGGGVDNKGAQAMTYTVVDQLSRIFPEKTICLLSTRVNNLPEAELANYTFDTLPWTIGQRVRFLDVPFSQVYPMEISTNKHRKVATLFEDCAFLVDISGYAITSQIGARGSLLKASNIMVAHEHSVPLYLLPQSIGPFNYNLPGSLQMEPLLRTYLTYPTEICTRELQGVQSLAPYTRDNVRKEFDLVLQYNEYDLSNVFDTVPEIQVEELPSNAVGIVPNTQVSERVSGEEFDRFYLAVMETLLDLDYSVVIFRHSSEDLPLCRRIEDLRDGDIHLLTADYNALELEALIGQLEFLVGSRYHSLIHSYRNNVPAIAYGWAEKYRELLREFNQSEFFTDCRSSYPVAEIANLVKSMHESKAKSKRRISTKRQEITRDSVISNLFERGY